MKQALYYSIASAGIAGLLMGGVMKLGPDALAERGGPQILISGESKRSIAPHDGAGGVLFASHNGEVPDYVLGSDWAQPPEFLTIADASSDEGVYEPLPAYEPEPQAQGATFVAPVKISAPPPVSYPSVDGDILGGLHDEPAALAQVVEAQKETDSLPS